MSRLALFLAATAAFVGSAAAQTIVNPVNPQLPTGVIGQAYSATFSVSPFSTVSWSIDPQTPLPPTLGLTLNSGSGVLSGTPGITGTFTFTVQATQSESVIASRAYTLRINPALSVTTTSLPNAAVGVPYSQALAATGGQTPYSWGVSGISFPVNGLTFNPATGVISGTPTAAAVLSFTAIVSDAATPAQTASGSVSFVITAPVTIYPSVGSGVVGQSYSGQFYASGGVQPYLWSYTFPSGQPPGLVFNSGGGVTGTPTQAGSYPINVQVRDGSTPTALIANTTVTLVIAQPLIITTTALPTATRNQAYNFALQVTGGIPPYIWSMDAPQPYVVAPGVTMSTAGVLMGTPTTTGAFTFLPFVQDSEQGSYGFGASAPKRSAATRQRLQFASLELALQVFDPLAITTTSLPAGAVGTSYTSTLAATGGEPSYTWTVVTPGTLPPGLTLSPQGQITGVPTAGGTYNVQIRAADSRVAGARTATASFSITIPAPVLTITTASPLPAGTVGTGYSVAFAATPTATALTWSISQGTPPPGVTISATGLFAGTPTTAGTYNFTVAVANPATAGQGSKAFAVTINPPSLVITTATPLPAGVVGAPYTQTLAATGGTPAYTWSVVAGALPGGLSLNAAGAITGTPLTFGTFTFTARVIDSGVGVGAVRQQTDKQFTLVIAPAQLTITTATPLPAGTFGVAYSQGLAASGGVAPYTWVVSSGTLPEGVTLGASGVVSGTPRSFGTFTFTARVTDSDTPAPRQAERQFTLEIRTTTLTILTRPALGSIDDSARVSYSLEAQGGVPPYTWTLESGSVPTGLTLSPNGLLTGLPAPGKFAFTARVTDRSQQTAIREFTLAVEEARRPLQIATVSVPEGNVGRIYAAVFDARGGSRPYSWSFSGLPGGIVSDREGGINGTPERAGTFTITAQVTDQTGVQTTGTFSLVIRPGTIIIEPTAAPAATAEVPYSLQASASGGLAPYRFSLSGDAPPGLTFTGGLLSGTPTEAGTFTFNIDVVDTAEQRGQRGYTLVVRPATLMITTARVADAQVGRSYSVALAATGGLKPYSWSATGSLPAGLSLGAETGAITGTPTTVGTFTFTAQVTDKEGSTANRTFTIDVRQPVTISGTLPSTGAVGAPISGGLTASGGLPPYKWSITSGTPPPGTTFSDGSLTGTPTTTGSFAFGVQVTDSAQGTASLSASIEILGALTITTQSLPEGGVGSAYSQTLAVNGGRGPYQWTASGLPAGLAIGPDGAITGTPTAAGSFTVAVTVTDASQPPLSASRSIPLQIALPAISAVVISGLPDTPAPAQQPNLTLSIGAAFPSELRGTVRLTFVPGAVNNSDDPSIQFSTGGRSAAFTIPTGSTQAVFPTPAVAIQTGTVAGTITITTSLTSGGNPVTCNCPLTRTLRIARAAPVITAVRVTRAASGFTVVVTGYSTTREVTQGLFRFSGSNLQTTEATVALASAMNTWFQGTSSANFGGQFVLTMPFTIQGDTTSVNQVTVTLSNAEGNSNAVSANF